MFLDGPILIFHGPPFASAFEKMCAGISLGWETCAPDAYKSISFDALLIPLPSPFSTPHHRLIPFSTWASILS